MRLNSNFKSLVYSCTSPPVALEAEAVDFKFEANLVSLVKSCLKLK